MSDTQEPDESGLAYSDNISIAWRRVGHELDQTHLARVNASNEEFLHAVTVMGESSGQKDPPDAGSAVAQELARVDLKLNLLLDLVASLIYRQMDIPETRPVRVSASGVSWRGEVPESGSKIYLELYIQRGLPKPLCCYGEVVSSDEDVAAGNARVRFVGLTGAAQSWLEKLIFRHHRREVAFKRSADSS